MAILALDNFNIPDGNTVSGTTADTGQVWSADIFSGGLGDAISWGGTKIGEKNTGATGVSSAFILPTTLPSADYSIRSNFEAGQPVPGPLATISIGLLGRCQQTTPSILLDYYAAQYNHNTLTWQLVIRNDNGGYSAVFDSSTEVLNDGQVYVLDLTMNGTSIILSVDGVVRISITDSHISAAGNPGVLAGFCCPQWSSTVGYWLQDFLVYNSTAVANTSFGIGQAKATVQAYGAEFGLYFAGSGTPAGEDFTPIDYGLPTPVIINNPQQGFEYAIPVTPLDLAGFISGVMGNVKLRRGGTSTNPSKVVLRGLSLMYKKKAT